MMQAYKDDNVFNWKKKKIRKIILIDIKNIYDLKIIIY